MAVSYFTSLVNAGEIKIYSQGYETGSETELSLKSSAVGDQTVLQDLGFRNEKDDDPVQMNRGDCLYVSFNPAAVYSEPNTYGPPGADVGPFIKNGF